METRKRRFVKNSDIQIKYNGNLTKKQKKNLFSFSTVFIVIFITLIMLVIINYFAPAPKLSNHVQQWRDSGYHFRYKQHDVFYQNIYKFVKKIEQEPALLVLHGFPTSSFDFNATLSGLKIRFPHIIIPDLLGLGFSSKPSPYEYTVLEQADIVEALLVHLNVPEVHVLAHDLGDSVAQELLSRQQEDQYDLKFSIKSLCLTNGGIIPSQHNPRPIQRLLMLPGVKHVMAFLTNRYIFYSRLSSVFGPNTQPTQSELYDYYSIFAFNGGANAVAYVLKYIPERHANAKRWVGALEKAVLPLHLIYGPLDPVNTPDGFLKEYEARIPKSTVTVLENISHYPHIEDPKRFIDSYMQFLDRIEREFYLL